MAKYRVEKDSLGTIEIAATKLWGPEAERARRLFTIDERKDARALFLRALFLVKKSAAQANERAGALSREVARAIAAAADEGFAGKLDTHIVVPLLNSGAGTSLHMNVNEVLARRAAQLLKKQGLRRVSVTSHDHVNFGQSTNDVIPTAIRVAALLGLDGLVNEGWRLLHALHAKEVGLHNVKVAGLTHLRDALPVRLGERFSAFYHILHSALNDTESARVLLVDFPLGGTAVGTGANAAFGYRKEAVQILHALLESGMRLPQPLPASYASPAQAMPSMVPYLAVSGRLATLAVELKNIAKDLEFMSGGPVSGLHILELPAVVPGSSIMPGKVNPSVCEHVAQVCHKALGHHAALLGACQEKQLELNTRMPVIAEALLESIALLIYALRFLREQCVEGIKANEARCRELYENTALWVTLLNPFIGYERAKELFDEVTREAAEQGISLLDAIASRGLPNGKGGVLDRETLEKLAFP